MTFDNDFLQIEFDGGTKRYACKAAGVDWPPPEPIMLMGLQLKRVRMSGISDEDRAEMSHVMRGAIYRPLPTQPKP